MQLASYPDGITLCCKDGQACDLWQQTDLASEL